MWGSQNARAGFIVTVFNLKIEAPPLVKISVEKWHIRDVSCRDLKLK